MDEENLRIIRFGKLELYTNGFCKSLYTRVFERENISGVNWHPLNSLGQKLMNSLLLEERTTCLLNNLAPQHFALIKNTIDTILTPEMINKRHQKIWPTQKSLDRTVSYSNSYGLFNDFGRLKSYADELVKTGLIYEDVHSVLHAKTNHEEIFNSSSNLPYKVKFELFYDGKEHVKKCEIRVCFREETSEEDKRKIFNFLIDNPLLEKLHIDKEARIPLPGDEETKFKYNYKLKNNGDEAYALLKKEEISSDSIPIYGKCWELERLIPNLIDQLDKAYAKTIN